MSNSSYVIEEKGKDWEDKKVLLEQRWAAKQLAREKHREQLRQERLAEKAPSQDVSAFQTKFKSLVQRVTQGLESASTASLDNDSRSARLDQLSLNVREIQKHVADAALYIPAYDFQQATKEVSNLDVQIEAARTAFAPRKKFSFSSRGKKKRTTERRVEKPASTKPSEAVAALTQSLELVYKNKSSEKIVLSGVDAGQDVLLSDMADCIVCILDPISALRCVNMTNCKVYSGPVEGSCFIEKAKGSSIYVAARQVRIHETTSTDFYLNVCSRPIIEHCTSLRFAEYALSYPTLTEHIKNSSLAETNNLYDQVDDFRWLRQQKSPNWSLIPKEEVIPVQL